jgi:tetratricopeptide (TPR) repeat protein
MRFLHKVSTGLAILSISLVILCYLFAPYNIVLAATTNTSSKSQTDISHGFLQQGIDRLQQNNFEEAIADFTKAIQEHENTATAYSNRCLAYLQIDNYAKAIADCSQAISTNSQNVEPYLNRGLAYFRTGNYTAAIADYDTMLQLLPNDYRGFYNRGLAQLGQGKYQNAIADYDQAIAVSQSALSLGQSTDSLAEASADIYIDRGIAKFMLVDASGAIADFSEAITLDDHNARAFFNRGCAYHRQHVFTQAIADFTISLQLDPHNPDAYLGRAIAQHSQGRDREAVMDLQIAASEFLAKGEDNASRHALDLLHQLQKKTIFT